MTTFMLCVLALDRIVLLVRQLVYMRLSLAAYGLSILGAMLAYGLANVGACVYTSYKSVSTPTVTRTPLPTVTRRRSWRPSRICATSGRR